MKYITDFSEIELSKPIQELFEAIEEKRKKRQWYKKDLRAVEESIYRLVEVAWTNGIEIKSL